MLNEARKPLVSAVKIGDEMVIIPPEFWLYVTEQDLDKNMRLKKRARGRLWEMLERTEPCPKKLEVFVDQKSVLDRYPPH